MKPNYPKIVNKDWWLPEYFVFVAAVGKWDIYEDKSRNDYFVVYSMRGHAPVIISPVGKVLLHKVEEFKIPQDVIDFAVAHRNLHS